jgi:hypothetical protein
MKTLTIFLALTFSVMFSSSSYAEWKEVGEDVKGNTFHVDLERIRKHDGYVYYWVLSDYFKPLGGSTIFSSKSYKQGDCKLFRFKSLSFIYHKEPFGRGTGNTVNNTDKEWTYPSPNSVDEILLKSACNR